MFWNDKDKMSDIIMSAPKIKPPSKVEFQTMREILNDAEKYDSNQEYDVSNALLQSLCDYAKNYMGK